MPRKYVRYKQSGRLLFGRKDQGRKAFDAQTRAPTFEYRLSTDDYGTLVDDAKYRTADYNPKKRT